MQDIGFIDVSAAVIGSTYSISWASIQSPPTLQQFATGQSDAIALYNESGVGWVVQLNNTGRSFTLPAGGWIPTLPASVQGVSDTSLNLTAQYILTNAHVSHVHADYFYPYESTTANSLVLGNSPVGGSVSVSNTPTIIRAPTAINTTTATTPLVITQGVSATGLYEVVCSFLVNNSGTATITVQVSYTEGFSGTSVTNRTLATSSGVALNAVVLANNGVGVCAATFYAKGGTVISFSFQDSTGTPNDSFVFGLNQMF